MWNPVSEQTNQSWSFFEKGIQNGVRAMQQARRKKIEQDQVVKKRKSQSITIMKPASKKEKIVEDIDHEDDEESEIEEVGQSVLEIANIFESEALPKPTQIDFDSILKNGWTSDIDEKSVAVVAIRDVFRNQGFSPNSIDQILINARCILERMGNPLKRSTEDFRKTTLVLGKVQSGKTSSMQALLAYALEAGYRFIPLLCGRTNILRNQTQKRAAKGLVFDSQNDEDVTNLDGFLVNLITTESCDISGANLIKRVSSIDPKLPIVLAIKKNDTTLRRLMCLLGINDPQKKKPFANEKQLFGQLAEYLKYPALIIDDECDDASLNGGTSRVSSSIHSQICLILNTFKTASDYIGYTATAQSNLLSDPDDPLFPTCLWFIDNNSPLYFGLNRFDKKNDSKKWLEIVSQDEYPNKNRNHSKKFFASLYSSKVNSSDSQFVLPSFIQKALIDTVFTGAVRFYRHLESTHPCNQHFEKSCHVLEFGSFESFIEKIKTFACFSNYYDALQANSGFANFGLVFFKRFQNLLTRQSPRDLGLLPTETLTVDSKLCDQIFALSPLDHRFDTFLELFDFMRCKIKFYCLEQTDKWGKISLIQCSENHVSLNTSPTLHIVIIPKNESTKSFFVVDENFIDSLMPVSKNLSSNENFYHAGLFHFSELQQTCSDAATLIEKDWKVMSKLIPMKIGCLKDQDSCDSTFEQMLCDRWSCLQAKSEETMPSLKIFEMLAVQIAQKIQIRLTIDPTRTLTTKVELLKQFDYDREKVPNFLIVIGGNILSRGITIEGLTVFCYLRFATNNLWDTVLQHMRIFGWKKYGIDMTTIYMQTHHCALMEEIVISNGYLEDDFMRFAQKGYDPREFRIAFKMSKLYQVTRNAMAQNLKKYSNALLIECDDPPREEGAKQILGITVDFVKSLGKGLKSTKKSTTFLDIDQTVFFDFLKNYSKIYEDNQSTQKCQNIIWRIMNMKQMGKITINLTLKNQSPSCGIEGIEEPIINNFFVKRDLSNHPIKHPVAKGDQFLDYFVCSKIQKEKWFETKQLQFETVPIARLDGSPIHVNLYFLDHHYFKKDKDHMVIPECPLVTFGISFPKITEKPMFAYNQQIPNVVLE